jgi:hypothetical protein
LTVLREFVIGWEKRMRNVSIPEDQNLRNEYPMSSGLLDYFPNALAEVSRLSYLATQQHHPGEKMHWDRSKSTDHLNKIVRHCIDAGKLDDKGLRHSTMLAWRALANLQEELERDCDLPPSKASVNRELSPNMVKEDA